MTNKLTCPSCNQAHDLSDYINNTNAEMAFSIALSVPSPLSILVLKYTQLFAPTKSKLSLDRRAKVIADMDLEGCDMDRIAYGINIMLERHAKGDLATPLKNHNYLIKVMSSYTPPDEAEKKKYKLSDKQVRFFGCRLCQDSNFAMKYAKTGESQGEFLSRIEHELNDPEKVKKWQGYLDKISQNASRDAL